MTEDMQVPDEQIVQCFGKHGACTRICRLKDICLEKHREQEKEKRQRRYRETCYIDGMDATAGHVAPDFSIGKDAGEDDFPSSEVASAIERLDVSEQCRRDLRRLFRAKADGEADEEKSVELLRRLGEMYINDPTGFEVLFFQALSGGNQAALARRRGCTKQNINKIVAKGRQRLAAYRQMVQSHPECRLTSREIAVYYYVVVERCSLRRAGVLLGIGKDTVKRTILGLSSKGFSCDILTPKRPIMRILRKILRNESLNHAEMAVVESVCTFGKSLRQMAKTFSCSHETIRKIRAFAKGMRQIDTPRIAMGKGGDGILREENGNYKNYELDKRGFG